MSESISLDFAAYVDRRREGFVGEYAGDRYAFSGDLELQRTMRNFKPIQVAVSSAVRLGKGMLEGDLLGSAVKVGPNQFPRVHKIVRHCTDVLGIPEPSVFIQGRVDVMNAMTTGTERESVIILYASTVDNMTDDELAFVIGHECGHIQNGHVIYLTTLNILTRVASLFLGPLVQPALIALQTWSRAAEITCDRAGMLCVRNVHAATSAFSKLAIGSMKLYDDMNLSEFLRQLEQGQNGYGRASELLKSHPYLPKRIRAVQMFSDSEVYRKSGGLEGGVELVELDKQVAELVKVL
ncbi:MAG: M48 family metallopeptidase [Deltaproteobacteria bacterium]|nr:M48 family metallopeptidase [Deltaproteobacteria bacterium]